jgi:hypothetical protein
MMMIIIIAIIIISMNPFYFINTIARKPYPYEIMNRDTRSEKCVL